MKNKLIIFTIFLLFLNTSVFAGSVDIGHGSGDHAQWVDSEAVSPFPTGLTCLQGETFTVSTNLDNHCVSHLDRVGSNPKQQGCRDGSYSVGNDDSNSLNCYIENPTGNYNAKLICECKKVGNFKSVVYGFPHEDDYVNENSIARRGSKEFSVEIRSNAAAPTSSNIVNEVDRGSSYTFSKEDFPFQDANGDSFENIVIVYTHNQNSAAGALYFNDNLLSENSYFSIPVNSLDKLVFVPYSDVSSSSTEEIFGFFVSTKTASVKSYPDCEISTLRACFLDDYSDTEISTNPYQAFMKVEPVPVNLQFNDIPDFNLIEDFEGEQSIDLSEYCPFGDSFSIVSETYDELVDLSYHAPSKEVRFTSKENKFGQNIVTIKCSESLSSPIENTLTINVQNKYDEIFIQKDNSGNVIIPELITSEGETVQGVLPLVNLDEGELVISITSTPLYGTFNIFERDNIYYANYTAMSGVNQQTETISYTVKDSSTYEIVGNIKITINDLLKRPDTLDRRISNLYEDETYTFNSNDFSFTDQDFNAYAGIFIYSIPQDGTLKLNGEPQNTPYIPVALEQISTLTYEPDEDEFGSNYASFQFSVEDSTGMISNPKTVTFDVKGQNDEPTILEFNSIYYSDSTGIFNVDENSLENYIFMKVHDLDGDELRYQFRSSNPAVVKDSNIISNNAQNNVRINIIPEKGVSDLSTVITAYIEDGQGGYNSDTFEVYIKAKNDPPSSANFTKQEYIYSKINFGLEDFVFNDLDIYQEKFNQFTDLQIIHIPDKGTLKLNDEPIRGIQSIPPSQIDKLSFEMPHGTTGKTYFTFNVKDNLEYSKLYNATIEILPSPFGEHSQPASFGGIPIPNFEYGEWSCKPGYEPVQSSLSYGYTCVKSPNVPPVANFTIYPLFDGYAKKGIDLNFKSFSYDKDYSGTMELNWSFTNQTTRVVKINEFNGSICTNGICTVSLTVFDGEDYNTLTKNFNFNEEDVVDNSNYDNYDFEDLIIEKGKIYDANELSALGLKIGSTVTKGSEKITVDNSGKITKVETLQLYTSEGKESSNNNYKGFTPGDGYCDKFQSENSVNSPQDCKESSGLLGIIIVFSFISILGILGFVAWKKGLFSKLGSSKKSIAKPVTYDAPSYTAPANNSAVPTSNFLSKMIKEKIDQGYSEGEIKSYLISKGYSESEIDNAINS